MGRTSRGFEYINMCRREGKSERERRKGGKSGRRGDKIGDATRGGSRGNRLKYTGETILYGESVN